MYHNVKKDLLFSIMNKMYFEEMITDNLVCLVGY